MNDIECLRLQFVWVWGTNVYSGYTSRVTVARTTEASTSPQCNTASLTEVWCCWNLFETLSESTLAAAEKHLQKVNDIPKVCVFSQENTQENIFLSAFASWKTHKKPDHLVSSNCSCSALDLESPTEFQNQCLVSDWGWPRSGVCVEKAKPQRAERQRCSEEAARFEHKRKKMKEKKTWQSAKAGLCKHSLSWTTGQFSIQLLESKKKSRDVSEEQKRKWQEKSTSKQSTSVCSTGWGQQTGEQVNTQPVKAFLLLLFHTHTPAQWERRNFPVVYWEKTMSKENWMDQSYQWLKQLNCFVLIPLMWNSQETLCPFLRYSSGVHGLRYELKK